MCLYVGCSTSLTVWPLKNQSINQKAKNGNLIDWQMGMCARMTAHILEGMGADEGGMEVGGVVRIYRLQAAVTIKTFHHPSRLAAAAL